MISELVDIGLGQAEKEDRARASIYQGAKRIETGLKYDQGKNRLELIPTELIDEVGKVLTFGASKYAANSWRQFKKSDFPRLIGALMRHLEAYRRGEFNDPESGLPHLAHIATNCGFLLHLDKPQEDDAFKALNALIEDLKKAYGGLVKPDIIYGISRGGMVPAIYIAHALGVRDVRDLKHAKENLHKGESTQVLVVDDISDTGDTLVEQLRKLQCSFEVATIFTRVGTSYEPDFTGKLITHDKWINFPWEVENVGNN